MAGNDGHPLCQVAVPASPLTRRHASTLTWDGASSRARPLEDTARDTAADVEEAQLHRSGRGSRGP